MAVLVMAVQSVEKHPNAEALMVYGFTAPGCDRLQVIANCDSVYQLGDRVAVALVDSVLKDGTKIKATKLRGMASYGMALGLVDASVGSDVTAVYGQVTMAQSVPMQKWPSIELLHNVRRVLQAVEAEPKITYRAKVKLDGTNAGVQVFPDGQVAAQSRSQIITPNNDNLGFAHWVNEHLDYFSQLAGAEHLTIFGEWCGKGIQSRTAVSEIDRKIFVVFAVQHLGKVDQVKRWVIDPEQITAFLPAHPDIYVLPFFGKPITLDFGDRTQLEGAILQLNQWVDRVEQADPWVQETFGITGLGEGVVLYPLADTLVDRLDYAELLFKAKGEKHQVVKAKQPVQMDPELVSSIDEFVQLFVTSNRLEQGVREACLGQLEMTQIATFLKWMDADVQKESQAELAAAQLTWKDVGKSVSKVARDWYLAQVKGVVA